jgi:cytochrome o ubiquinol oxidase subunit 2
MDKKMKFAFLFLILFGIVAISSLAFFSDRVIILSPKGMIGEKERDLLMLSTYIMLFVVIPVFLLTFYIVWRYRAGHKNEDYQPEWDNSHLAEAVWWGVPFVIIVILGVITWKSCHELDPFKPLQSETKPLRIQVVALQWKWLFIYPDQNIATVNDLRFPVGAPLNFEVSADAPMNSFWIPELGGQIYAMSGMRSKLHLIANEPGQFRGFSANISGEGFAGMSFMARAVSNEEFDAWVQGARNSPPLDYETVVQPSQYVPPAVYSLGSAKLFDEILMKYMMPKKEMMHGH